MGDVKSELQKTRAPAMPKNENKDLPNGEKNHPLTCCQGVQGVHKKMRHSFCLISLATDMLEGWNIIHWTGWINSLVCTIFMSRDITKLKWGIRFQKF